MSDDSIITILGTFSTRDAAERSIEYLVQEHGIARGDVFIGAGDGDNSAGRSLSEVDAEEGAAEGSTHPAPLHGAILVSADVGRDVAEKAENAFRSAGATAISRR